MAETNASIVGAFLKDTNDFEQFAPSESQQAIAAVLNNPYSPMANQFFNLFQSWLVQRIGKTILNNNVYENQLKEFKGSTMRFGNTVQNIMLKYADVYSYEDDAETLLKNYILDGKVQYVSVNRRDKIPITINREELQAAFVDEYGLNAFINNQFGIAISTDNYVEYSTMKMLPAQQDKETPLYRYPAYDAEPSTKEQAEDFLVDLQAIADNMSLPNYGSIYTPAHVPTVAKPSDCVLLIKAKPKAQINVKAYANFFNIDEGKAPFRIIFVDDFGIDGCFAALTTIYGFICNDVVYETRDFNNPETLALTQWLHHWELMGINLAAPWILFGTGENWNATSPAEVEEKVTSIKVTPEKTTASAGDTVALTVELQGTLTTTSTGTATPDELTVAPDAATYEVSAVSASGSSTPVLLNARTYVEPLTGTLHIQKSGLASKNVITVKATSIKDATKSATCTVTIA